MGGIMRLIFKKEIKMKKVLSACLLVGISLFGFGCEKKEDSSSSSNKTVELQIWVTRAEADVLQALGKEYASRKNNKVRTNFVVFENQAELADLLVDQMAEGYGPDVIYVDGDWVALNRNKVVGVKDDALFSKGKFEETFVKGAVDTLITDSDEVLGMPLGVDSLALIYNEDHLSNALSDRNQPGKTWVEFRSDTEKLNRPDKSFERFAISGAALGRLDNVKYGFDILENIMFQAGVKFFTEDGTKSKIASSSGVTSEGKRENFGEEAVSYFTSFADDRYKNFSWTELLADSQSPEKEYQTFAEGKVSMIFGYARDYEYIQEVIKDRRRGGGRSISTDSVRVAFLPQINDPDHSHTRDVVSKIPSLAVPLTSQNPRTAWDFLLFAVQEKNMKSFYDETKIPTSRLSLIPEQEVEPGFGIFVRQAKFAEPNFIHIPREEFVLNFEKMILLINGGRLTPLEGLRELETIFTNRLQSRVRKLKEIKGARDEEDNE